MTGNGQKGRIYKGIGGFYFVKTQGGQMVQCKPRGIFRKLGQKPLPGDEVVLQSEAETQFISQILPRTNALVRPPVANVSQLIVVVSTTQPKPSFLVIDKLCASAFSIGARPVLVFTKQDIESPDFLLKAYKNSGIKTVLASTKTGQGLAQVEVLFKGNLSVFCGNSGVGKSTLLNAIAPQLKRQVAPISQKLGRGKHTTREVEIFELGEGLVADTPGFASFDADSGGEILPQNLQLYFPEIEAVIGQCKFSGCAHVADAGCAVIKAVQEGKIAQSRHQSYVAMYALAKKAEAKGDK